jgi:hypothetical protein
MSAMEEGRMNAFSNFRFCQRPITHRPCKKLWIQDVWILLCLRLHSHMSNLVLSSVSNNLIGETESFSYIKVLLKDMDKEVLDVCSSTFALKDQNKPLNDVEATRFRKRIGGC